MANHTIKQKIKQELSKINRPGISNLIEYLDNTDFYTAPASTRYHNAYEGGLAEHSWDVFRLFRDKCSVIGSSMPMDSIRVIGLLHDICKIGLYKKKPGGYICIGKPEFHGVLSLKLLMDHITLSEPEMLCIKFHMGTFGCSAYKDFDDILDLDKAIRKEPYVQIFASTDMEAVQMEKKRGVIS